MKLKHCYELLLFFSFIIQSSYNRRVFAEWHYFHNETCTNIFITFKFGNIKSPTDFIKCVIKQGLVSFILFFSPTFDSPTFLFNTLTVNYEITRRLRSLPKCQTTSYLVLTHIKKFLCFWQVF